MSKINIILPANNKLSEISKCFVKIKKNSPEYFLENIARISLFGCFSYCIWALAQQEKMYHSREEIEQYIQFIIDNDSAVYFDFLNTKIQSEHLYDSYSNLILTLTKNINVNAFVSSNILKSYIKENYTHVNINTDNIIYLNSYCENCKECYDKKSEDKLNFEKALPYSCEKEVITFGESIKRNDFISQEKLQDLIIEGHTDFIIREQEKDKYEFIESCLYYLIKPEYQNIVRLKVLKSNIPNIV